MWIQSVSRLVKRFIIVIQWAIIGTMILVATNDDFASNLRLKLAKTDDIRLKEAIILDEPSIYEYTNDGWRESETSRVIVEQVNRTVSDSNVANLEAEKNDKVQNSIDKTAGIVETKTTSNEDSRKPNPAQMKTIVTATENHKHHDNNSSKDSVIWTLKVSI